VEDHTSEIVFGEGGCEECNSRRDAQLNQRRRGRMLALIFFQSDTTVISLTFLKSETF